MSSEDDDIHALAPFLETRLPELGLDYELYGAYILPLLSDEDADEEAWETVIELLRGSSELEETSDDSVWEKLRNDIQSAWKAHCEEKRVREKEFHDHRETEIQQQIERDRRLAKEAAIKQEEERQNDSRLDLDSAAKQALMERFGYDDDDDARGKKEDEEQPLTNRQVAKQLDVEKTKAMREHKTATKREEQQKTAQAKQNKIQLKEERRKRATKGERKR